MSSVAIDFLPCSVVTDFSRLSVATENPKIRDFPCPDMGLMSRQCTAEACGDRALSARDRVR